MKRYTRGLRNTKWCRDDNCKIWTVCIFAQSCKRCGKNLWQKCKIRWPGRRHCVDGKLAKRQFCFFKRLSVDRHFSDWLETKVDNIDCFKSACLLSLCVYIANLVHSVSEKNFNSTSIRGTEQKKITIWKSSCSFGYDWICYYCHFPVKVADSKAKF